MTTKTNKYLSPFSGFGCLTFFTINEQRFLNLTNLTKCMKILHYLLEYLFLLKLLPLSLYQRKRYTLTLNVQKES